MKFKAFDIFEPEDVRPLEKFIDEHNIIDVKPVQGDGCYSIVVLYNDNPRKYRVKYFNESEYRDLSDAVNTFCSKHDVAKIETTQNNDEELVTVVTYKE
ncbi:hypothetical protein [Lactobacillus crispatus]|uniref:hypothetical protein n=1 Tax=Lactobacillus crispatus TaxID=47770 RepID=UPI0015DDC7B0|nr:hypothetical protein [Lactobacillus crispatus]QLK33415.1 hypothetical protein H0G71_04225 [Lactobacillus crispatus]